MKRTCFYVKSNDKKICVCVYYCFKYIYVISLRGARSILTMKKNNYLIILCISYLIPCNWAINVGIGISDVTGPAAEIGMVRFILQENFCFVISSAFPDS